MGKPVRFILAPIQALSPLFKRTSIVVKLTLFVGALVALTAGTLIAVGYAYTSEMLREQVHNHLSAVVEDRRALLMREMARLEERARIFSTRFRITDLLERNAAGILSLEDLQRTLPASLEDVRRDSEEIVAAWIEDREGRPIAACGPTAVLARVQDRTDHRWLESSRDPALVGLPRSVQDSHVAVIRTRVRTRTQTPTGTIFLVMEIGGILGELSDPRLLGSTGEVLVGVRQGETMHYLFPPRLSPEQTEVPASRARPMIPAVAGNRGFARTVDRLGRDVLVAYRPVGYEEWGLIAKMDVAEAYAPVHHLRRLLLAIGGAILLLGLSASYLIARQNTRMIRRLAAAADAVAGGNLNAVVTIPSRDEIGTLGAAFRRMTGQLARAQANLEQRIAERTRDLVASRDLLDAFFQVFTSRPDADNIDRTFDSVLRFCHQLGYDLAMISLVDHEHGVIRGARGAGSMSDVVQQTVRSLEGDDILALVIREGRTTVVSDSTTDPRCEPAAVARAKVRGQVVLPLVGDRVLGTLQVATPEIIDPEQLDLRPLESLASHTARALNSLSQVEEISRLNCSLERQASELVKSEAALREQTRILQSVLDCMGEGVVVADTETRLIVFNPAAQRILGGTSGLDSDGRWSPMYRVYRGDRLTPFSTEELPLYRAIRGESVDHIEVFIAHPSIRDGLWMLVNARPLRDEQGGVHGGLVVFHDITRRKSNERRLAVQYAVSRLLAEADSLTDASPRILEIVGRQLDWDFGTVWRVEQSTQQLSCVAVWHDAELPLTSFAECTRRSRFAPNHGLPGRVWADRRSLWFEDLSEDAVASREPAAVEAGLKSGFAAPIMVREECLGILEFWSRDQRSADPELQEMATSLGRQIGQFIERHQMRARVVQSEKLASLGLLSAMVAHDINNPLAYIANNLVVLERDIGSLLSLLGLYEQAREVLSSARPELLEEVERLSEECDLPYIRESLDKILDSTRQGVKRVAAIVNNLRGFARLDRATVDQIDIHDALNSALEMIRGRLQRHHIAVEERQGELPLVSTSPVQINQVFLNLLVNAMQAIESTNRQDGRIEIHTAARGTEVVIEIKDNGCGIPPEMLPLIFDPFFTTKSVGDGTGLGLSITHGIVQDHGGRLEVESTPGEGTCFRVILPVTRK